MLSDTVGFIRRLPHHLVASFRATLEETVHAHLLLLVVDAADPRGPLQLATVRRVLDEIGATDQPRVVVLNKIDRLAQAGAGTRRDPALAEARLAEWRAREPGAIAVSALTGEGLDRLAAFARTQMLGDLREVSVALPMSDGRGIDFLEKRTEVSDRAWEGDRAVLRVRVARRHLLALLSRGSRPVVDGMPAHDAIRALWPPPPKPESRGLPPHERLVGDAM
jgi:GTP-binding protein HflX